MPAPEPVSAALMRVLQDGVSSSSGASSATSSIRAALLEPVDFEEAGEYQQSDLVAGFKHKYRLLKPDSQIRHLPTAKAEPESNGLPAPKHVLFPVSSVKQGWRHGWQVGSGMQNFGNTCYLNSTLQAVFHVSAFANWLTSENHTEKCGQQNACIICGMKKTLIDTQNSSGPIKPWQIYTKLRSICRHLTPGRQEDAHEFLRYLVEAMEKAYLSQFDGAAAQLDQYSKETTPLNQILGGYLRSVVRCLACGRVSTTFQHFQDLLVDARKASTIDEALETFFSRERLEDLGYKCEFCNKKVSATKQFYIERPPMVLCIALKRFSLSGGKLTKHVQFRPRLSLDKYMHNQNGPLQLTYRLVSIVTHLGHSQNCGHYTAAGVGPNGSFYQFDDTSVREIPLAQVLTTNAYILFYELGTQLNNNNPAKGNNQIMSLCSMSKESRENISNFIGPMLPKSMKGDDENTNKSLVLAKDNTVNITIKDGLNGSKPKSSYLSITYKANNNNNGLNDFAKEKTEAGGSSHTVTADDKPNLSTKVNSSNNCPKQTLFDSNNPSACSSNGNGLKTSAGNFSIYSRLNTNGKLCDKSATNGNAVNGGSDHSQKGEKSISMLSKSINGLSKSGEPKTVVSDGKTYGAQSKHSTAPSDCNVIRLKVKSGDANGPTPTPTVSPLVPYDSESSRDNQDDPEDENCNVISTDKSVKHVSHKQTPITNFTVPKATSQDWKVSREIPESRPSFNNKSPNKMQSNASRESSGDGVLKEKETVAQLQHMSHRGYGASVTTWMGTHSQMNRQVFEDKKNEFKRAAEADDEMDRGRTKKMKYHHNNNNNYNKYYSGRNNYGNPFQENQNQRNKWPLKYHNYRNYKYKGRGRYNPHYSRHHSNNHYNHQFNRNH